MISKIVSGGQTGVDRAALDFAIRRGITHGGFCPKGRRSESGKIPDKYSLTETSSPDYLLRTVMNVQNSDGTLIVTRGRPEGGTRKTISYCIRCNKPRFIVDLERRLIVREFAEWIRLHNIRILNIAGPRESKQPGIGKETMKALSKLFAALT
jgi:predicted Rossmann-fold nucleotide-binding protein